MNEASNLRGMTNDQLQKLLIDLQTQKPKERIAEPNQGLNLVSPVTSAIGGGLAASGGNPVVGGLAASGAGALTELALLGARNRERKKLEGSADRVSDERRDQVALITKVQQELARRQVANQAMARLQQNAANAASVLS